MLYCTKSYRLIRRNFLFSLQVNLSKGKQHGKHANLSFKPVTETKTTNEQEYKNLIDLWNSQTNAPRPFLLKSFAIFY